MIEFLKIIALAMLAATLYGVVHDQFTARICVEYFTLAHPPVFNTTSPTLLALGWGIIATWWMGFVLGLPAAWLARVGSRPKISAAQLVRPIAFLLAIMATAAATAGLLAFALATSGQLTLEGPLAERIPTGKHAAFWADCGAHLASYGVGFFGGVTLCCWIWIQRRVVAAKQTRDLTSQAPERN